MTTTGWIILIVVLVLVAAVVIKWKFFPKDSMNDFTLKL